MSDCANRVASLPPLRFPSPIVMETNTPNDSECMVPHNVLEGGIFIFRWVDGIGGMLNLLPGSVSLELDWMGEGLDE